MKPQILKDFKSLVFPLAILCNTTIGIGMFSLPYVASKIGLPLMALYFSVLVFVVYQIHSMFAQVALKTPDYKRLPGFAKYHLGLTAEIVVSACVITGIIGSMVAFMAIGGEFLYNLAPSWLGLDITYCGILYLLAASLLVFLGINLVQKVEFWGLILFFFVLVIMLFKAMPGFSWQNLGTQTGGLKDFFLPYGPLLFSLWGASSIPEVEEMLARRRKKKFLPLLILMSCAIAAAVYLIFTLFVVGITGSFTTESALIGFGHFFGDDLLNLMFAFGLVTTFTSFVIGGLTLKKILHYDLGVSKTGAWLVATIAPLLLFIAGLNNFLAILSFIGGVMLGIEGIIILMIYNKVAPRKKFIIYPLGIIFALGIFYEIYYFLKF